MSTQSLLPTSSQFDALLKTKIHLVIFFLLDMLKDIAHVTGGKKNLREKSVYIYL
jgi:hypothetical protein